MLSRYLYAEVLTVRVVARVNVCTYLLVMFMQEVRGEVFASGWLPSACGRGM